jgi:hypothetical protein
MIFKLISIYFLSFIQISISKFNDLNCLKLIPTEYFALKEIYDSNSGPYWKWENILYKWNFSSCSDPCLATWEVFVIYMYKYYIYEI